MDTMREAEAIRDILKKVPLPDTVVGVFQHLDVDSTGVPAVWVRVVLDDAVVDSGALTSVAAEIRETIRDALQQAGIDRWPYVRFRTQSEMAELGGEPWR